jgi:DNA-binding transcriptional MerR regulator
MTGGGMRRGKGRASLSLVGEGASSTIPDKLYFRIGEVAALCGVATSVLRFWESEFPQLKPNKGGNGQRLYRRRDLEMALRIKGLLYGRGMTISGARRVLKAEPGPLEPQLCLAMVENEGGGAINRKALRRLRGDLQELAGMLSAVPPASNRSAKAAKVTRMTRMARMTRGLALFD